MNSVFESVVLPLFEQPAMPKTYAPPFIGLSCILHRLDQLVKSLMICATEIKTEKSRRKIRNRI